VAVLVRLDVFNRGELHPLLPPGRHPWPRFAAHYPRTEGHEDLRRALEGVAAAYDQRYGTNFSGMRITTEGEANEAYEELRPNLYPYYSAW
jgi:hypothetical protein